MQTCFIFLFFFYLHRAVETCVAREKEAMASS